MYGSHDNPEGTIIHTDHGAQSSNHAKQSSVDRGHHLYPSATSHDPRINQITDIEVLPPNIYIPIHSSSSRKRVVFTPTPDCNIENPMHAVCLVGKNFGESIPKHLIEGKMKRSWSVVKYEVTFQPMGNFWLLITFSNAMVKQFIWDNRPWFVQGLNFVLQEWHAAFCPFSAKIENIDQWVKIHLLPFPY